MSGNDLPNGLSMRSDKTWHYFSYTSTRYLSKDEAKALQATVGYIVAGYGFESYSALQESPTKWTTRWKCSVTCE